jgi:hypothetical protein
VNEPSPHEFIGWIRRGDGNGRWFAVARGFSPEAVFGRLLTMMEGGDKAVLPSDLDPNDTLPYRRRRI